MKAALVALLLAGVAAFPSFRYKIPNGDRVPCPEGQDGCEVPNPERGAEPLCYGVGHSTCAGGGSLNPFGVQFLINDYEWTTALCEDDSDGDGLTNGEELGDPCCLWVDGADDVPAAYAAQLAAWAVSHPGFASSTSGQRALCDAYSVADRGTYRESFFLDGEDQYSFELYIDDWPLRDIETSYVDFVWDIPAEHRDRCAAGDCYLVGSEALIDATPYVHHFVIRGCTEEWYDRIDGYAPGMMRAEGFSNGCSWSLMGWAPGRHPMTRAPDEAANSIRGLTGFSMQVHYDNPAEVAGVVDRSGFRVHYTTTPRAHVAAGIVGQRISFMPSLSVPAGTPRWFLTRQCTISGATDAINLYGTSFHAHLLGREMYMEIWRDGVRSELRDERVWHFDDQVVIDRVRGRTLRNGDVIQSTCVMDSTARTAPTIFATGTSDEMCWATLNYYPYQATLECDGDSWTGTLEPEDRAELIPVTHPPLCAGATCLHLDDVPCDPAELARFTSDAAAIDAIEEACAPSGRTPLRECDWLVHHIRECARSTHAAIDAPLAARLDALVAVLDGIFVNATLLDAAAPAATARAGLLLTVGAVAALR